MSDGKLNEEYGVSVGSQITIDHLIVLKLYTDYDGLQRKFKLHQGSPETFWFFRLLKEATLFFGQRMKSKEKLYCGLKEKLLFESMVNLVEGPLSTTQN